MPLPPGASMPWFEVVAALMFFFLCCFWFHGVEMLEPPPRLKLLLLLLFCCCCCTVNYLISSHLVRSMKDRVGTRLPTFTEEESMLLAGSNDFFGLNHYTSWQVDQEEGGGCAKQLTSATAAKKPENSKASMQLVSERRKADRSVRKIDPCREDTRGDRRELVRPQ